MIFLFFADFRPRHVMHHGVKAILEPTYGDLASNIQLVLCRCQFLASLDLL